jgi:hypothetical protein
MTSITAILSRSTSPPLPQRPCPGVDEAGRAPELVCQFVQEFFEAGLRYGLAVARSRGQEDLYEV